MLTFTNTLYQVWVSRGEGMVAGPKFRDLDDARRYIDEHCAGASAAIKAPDGQWPIIRSRRMARGTRP